MTGFPVAIKIALRVRCCVCVGRWVCVRGVSGRWQVKPSRPAKGESRIIVVRVREGKHCHTIIQSPSSWGDYTRYKAGRGGLAIRSENMNHPDFNFSG
jgi:hypothetical protein